MNILKLLPYRWRWAINDWRLISRIHDRNPQKRCWASCVSWAYGHRPLKDIESACSHPDERPCYCGAWYAGKCLAGMTREQVDKWCAEADKDKPLPFDQLKLIKDGNYILVDTNLPIYF